MRNTGGSRRTAQVIRVAAFFLVAAVALGVRLYRLGEESVSYEEYVGFAHLDAPDVATYIHLTRQLNRPMGPLPYVLLYFWAHTAGGSVVALRMLSVCLGMLVVGLLYAFARTFYGGGLFGHRAGIIAALCVTFAPIHIFFAQEARQYPILILAALMSAFALLKGTRTKKTSWLALNGLMNLAAAAAHPFGILVAWTEGIYLVLFRPLRLRSLVVRGILHAIVVGGWFLWVKDIHISAADILGANVPQYNLRAFLADLFKDDVIYAGASVPPATNLWPFLTPGFVRRFHGAHIVMDRLLLASSFGALLWGVVWACRRNRTARAMDNMGTVFPF